MGQREHHMERFLSVLQQRLYYETVWRSPGFVEYMHMGYDERMRWLEVNFWAINYSIRRERARKKRGSE